MARFRYSDSVVLDGSGNGQVRLAPTSRNWAIDYLTVRCATHVAEARASVYENYVGPDYLIDATLTGSSGDTTDTAIRVAAVEKVGVDI